MRFATRTFLWSFIPFALLLVTSFWAVERMTVSAIRNGLQASLGESQILMEGVRSRGDLHNRRFLRVLGESAPLKAGIQLLRADPKSAEVRSTVEDQLREICETLGFDFLLLASPDREALVGVMRDGEQLVAMDTARMRPPREGLFAGGARTYQVASVPVDQAEESIGILTVGEEFDLSEFPAPAVLARNGRVLRSSVPGVRTGALEAALKECGEKLECEVRVSGETYLSQSMGTGDLGDGYVWRSFQSVDRASSAAQAMIRKVFGIAGVAGVLLALALSVFASRSIVEPIARVVSRLRESEQTGTLPGFHAQPSPIAEIRELTGSLDRAASSSREARERLHQAYVEFVQTLASALDARDPYTAGHSRRVSEYSCSIAQKLQLSAASLEDIRVGALLHDIGKIGISDRVLQNPGPLSREEMTLIQQHPAIGRRILEGVHGFEPYLSMVELHHENWDGTGYPWGMRAEVVPLAARIVHVADAFDAMTTDRPYRKGMSEARALRELEQYAGTQFDPTLVQVFVRLRDLAGEARGAAAGSGDASLRGLAEAVNEPASEAARPGAVS